MFKLKHGLESEAFEAMYIVKNDSTPKVSTEFFGKN